MYVILNKEDYDNKIQQVLEDTTKFKKLRKNPTEELKKTVNALITANNAEIGSQKLLPISGEYKPGYIYGNIKTHKVHSPIRPIISQIPTPVYHVSKKLNEIISNYTPSRYSIRSTEEFLEILSTKQPGKDTLASLDADSLFTNVPVEETIDIICKYVYQHPALPPPKIKPDIMRKLLRACTTQVPFTDHNGRLYTQINGVSMGSPLAPTFAEYYVAHIENGIFEKVPAPNMYVRYVDDILILTDNTDEVHKLKDIFQKESVLTFSHEFSNNSKIPFLDVLVDFSNNTFTTSPYKKPTSANSCLLNYRSECPDRYKTAVIKNFIKRAKLISSTPTIFYKALADIKQTLINNGFTNSIVDQQIRIALKRTENNSTDDLKKYITIYYCNQIHPNYRQDENTIKKIIKTHVIPKEPMTHIKTIIYYKKFKTSSIIVKNSGQRLRDSMSQTNVVYQFKCSADGCQQNDNTYIGMTSTSLSRRLSCHITNLTSSIIDHLKSHDVPRENFRRILVDNTKILTRNTCQIKLAIIEALLIKENKPTLNKINYQQGNNVLAIF